MITFVSYFYIIKSKFKKEKYKKWINYLLPNIRNFNLVVFCDNKSYLFLKKLLPNKDIYNSKIKLIILEKNEFYNYRYKDYWKKNHKNNNSLNDKSLYKTDWELNMLWNEKIY